MKFFRLAAVPTIAMGVASLANAQAPTSTFLGNIFSTNGVYDTPDVLVPSTSGGIIKWYKFSILSGATNSSGIYLDIDTVGSNFDTEIGLFDESGTLLASNDDSGPAPGMSLLSFGLTNPPRKVTGVGDYPGGGGTGASGQNGDLGAGTYYLALTGFDANFSNNWTVTTNNTDTTHAVNLNFRTNIVPEPASMAALGLGVVALLRRKKK